MSIREVKATEATLERIYDAAYLGLKGDALALAAGLLPVEFNRLKQLDQIAELAEAKGRADSERDHSQTLLNAARAGDAKMALEILKHTHGWVAKQAVSVEIDQRISVLDALRAAEGRVIEGSAVAIEDAQQVQPLQPLPQSALQSAKRRPVVQDAQPDAA